MKKPTSGDEILLNSGLIAVIIKQNGYEPNGIVWYELNPVIVKALKIYTNNENSLN